MSATFFPTSPAAIRVAPEKLTQIQSEFASEWKQIVSKAQAGELQVPKDRRFNAPAWAESQQSLLTVHAYLLSAKTLNQLVDAAEMADDARKRLSFSVMQWIEATSPSNFMATNPDVQRTMIETQGKSLVQGMQFFFQDLQKGRMTQTDEAHFQIGENIATTKGSVVYQNQLFELIQYSPLTEQVYKTPLLIVPPCINKYYILDLQPENSFVRHAVQAGHTVFLVSWRNPLPSDQDDIQHATWDDYIKDGVLQAIEITRSISKQKQINALGFCVGGTLLATALSLAKARGEDPVASITLLTTFLDFSDTGVLDIFADEKNASHRDQQFANGGLMPARELSTTFSFLRPGELVWNYVVSNYLKGVPPPAFDLLYWNSDGTNLPGPFFSWYFRNTYVENNLAKPGAVEIDGYPIDFGSLAMPAYVYASREDHIVPWNSAYATTKQLAGDLRFVLGASGHVAGVINPPAKNRRNYWLNETPYTAGQFPDDPEQWLDSAVSHPGSWWTDWSNWLAGHGGTQVKAKASLGSTQYPPLTPAPGEYVQVKAV